ncbi:MAG: Fic family protein [Litorimonas sp.]
MTEGMDWDRDSPEMRARLRTLLNDIELEAVWPLPISAGRIRGYHTTMMTGFDDPALGRIGRFRGEAGLWYNIEIGDHLGVEPQDVAVEMETYLGRLNAGRDAVDTALLPPNTVSFEEMMVADELPEPAHRLPLPDANGLRAVLTLCAFAHSDFVRIHPLANGNGRMARLLANMLAMRYGLPPFVTLRSRPGGRRYAEAATASMNGDWQPTKSLFMDMLDEALDELS